VEERLEVGYEREWRGGEEEEKEIWFCYYLVQRGLVFVVERKEGREGRREERGEGEGEWRGEAREEGGERGRR
jgi:hypothetical protein